MRLGVLECFVKMDQDLLKEESKQVTDLLKKHLGAHAERCGEENERVVTESAKFLGIWPSRDSKELLLGMARNCPTNTPRIQAINDLPKVAGKLAPEDREAILASLQQLYGTAPQIVKPKIDDAIQKIRGINR